jgi:hypothetical protein
MTTIIEAPNVTPNNSTKYFLSTSLEQVVNLTLVGHLSSDSNTFDMTLLYTRHASKSKAELLEVIVRLEKEIKSRNDEIATLKKKISIYKTI